MDPNLLLVIVYRIVTMLVGLAFAFLGYRLFDKAVLGQKLDDNDLEAIWGKGRFLLRRAAPGTLFALFGAAIIVVALIKSVEWRPGVIELSVPSEEPLAAPI